MQSISKPNLSASGESSVLCCDVCGNPQLCSKFSVPLLDGPYQNSVRVQNRKIYECDICGHLSADLYDPRVYARYYSSLRDDYHSCHDYDRSRYKQILKSMPKEGVRRVLDLGCGTGTFLSMLPPSVERYGIEPSEGAAKHATAKGVKIIKYEDLKKPELQNTFDVVTAIDVVEHTKDLCNLRRHLVDALRPRGMVVILTGNSQSWSARWLGRYWAYLNFSEHITFFCPRSIQSWLQPDFAEITLVETGHHPLNGHELIGLMRVWLLFPLKLLLRRFSPVRLNACTALSLPGDHMLVRAIYP